ncbi:uncharacterized protein LOC124195428 isoform X1 [Daphnia pulex]|uniref:uncharacterized protein LOC124195428 isoform X1 n=1 Tax=Daphnia pulex TaxID=6669 RepID=UPI001EDD83D2|nr:uncharacterized protein LOC124195428 isoform X1 [Daphnia pulex]
MFGNVSPAVVLLFKISIIGYCCFGDQQSFSERQVSRPWIQELLTQEKSRNLTSATTNADGYLKSQNVQLSRIPTDVSLQVFRFAGNKSLQRRTKSNAGTILFVPKFVIAVGAIAAAIAVAVTSHGKHTKIEEIDIDFRLLNILTPINDLPMPVTGVDFPSDGCGDNSVRFNGTCFPVLHKGPCHRIEWVTIDPITLQGRCTPRLCGRERVLVVRDGLCHDIYDPGECQGGRRLYYTAYGDPICDCPIGQYPFPHPHDNCVPLFTQGPCQDGYVVSINQDGRLGCTPAECESTDGKDFLQQLVLANKACYVLGSRGPCSTTSQLLGYDIFKRRLQCVNLLDPFSPYFSWHEENNLLDSIYNHLHLESDEFRTSLVYQSLEGRNDTLRRQGANTAGIFQFPSSSPETLLNPCRTGARQGTNYKCTNPLVPNMNRRDLLPVVRPGVKTNCEGNAVFIAVTGQCRPRF